jgi:hypothetical protein
MRSSRINPNPVAAAVRALLPIAVLGAGTLLAADAPAGQDAVTIYSSMQPGAVAPEWYRPAAGRHNGWQVPGYAIVRHDREYELQQGVQKLRVTDVAELIDPTTVTFSSLDQAATRVLEQSFQFDLVSQARLLQRYLGQRITVEQPRGDTVDLLQGKLVGIGDGLTLQLDDGSVQAVRSYGNIRFPELPGGLITRPTLEWLLDSPVAGPQSTRIAYETSGMTWWADYTIVYDESTSCTMDLSAWVTIINQSGAGYEDARLKLIAGDVNRAERHAPAKRNVVYRMAMEEMAPAAPFEERAFFEYHLYTLQRPATLPDQSTRQLQLLPAAQGLGCSKELVFAPTLRQAFHGHHQLDQDYARYQQGDVEVYLQFENDEDNALGVPLPAGRIRVMQADRADDSLEFIGEDVIDHTPRNEEVRITMGNAFDVVGERRQTDFRIDTRTRNLWESFEIRLRNHKPEAVEITVLESLYRTANWAIEDASQAHVKERSDRIRFKVTVPPDGESVIRYTAHYDW